LGGRRNDSLDFPVDKAEEDESRFRQMMKEKEARTRTATGFAPLLLRQKNVVWS
jgi:hypothetical protein